MNSRHRTGLTIAVALTAGLAGWASVRSPEAARPNVVLAALTARNPDLPAVTSKPTATSSEALTALEKELVRALDPGAGTFSGERLMELCLKDYATNLPGPNAANSYAKGWATKDPQEMFEWFQTRGGFHVPKSRFTSHGFLNTLFHQWAKQDATAAIAGALACAKKRDQADALLEVINVLRKSDPVRATALAAEHLPMFAENSARGFHASGAHFRETLDFLRALPPGTTRAEVLAHFYDGILNYHGAEMADVWKATPDTERRALIAAGFPGTSAIQLSDFDGLPDLHRAHIEQTGDPTIARRFLATGAHEWAQRDPAAAVAWAQQHLKGEQRVHGAAQLFRPAAEKNFDATLQLWNALPDGILRARAAGHLAAGAPSDRKDDVEAILASLSPADRGLAATARRAAEDANRQRQVLEGMREVLRPRQP